MAKVGRKPFHDQPTKWNLHLPSSLAEQVEKALADPLTGKTRHGARSRLITRLLREWMRERERALETAPEFTNEELENIIYGN